MYVVETRVADPGGVEIRIRVVLTRIRIRPSRKKPNSDPTVKRKLDHDPALDKHQVPTLDKHPDPTRYKHPDPTRYKHPDPTLDKHLDTTLDKHPNPRPWSKPIISVSSCC